MCETCNEDTLGCEVDRPELLVGLEVESVLADRDLEHLCDLFLLLAVRCDTVAEDDTVDGDLDICTKDGVECLHGVAVVCGKRVGVAVPEEPDSDF